MANIGDRVVVRNDKSRKVKVTIVERYQNGVCIGFNDSGMFKLWESEIIETISKKEGQK